MNEYIIAKNKYEEAEHTIVRVTEKFGISIIRMEDLDGPKYSIAPIKFTGREDQYDLLNERDYVTRDYSSVENFVNKFIKS